MNNLNKNNFHITVLKKEAVDSLEIIQDSWYIDCTLGGAGHTKEILKKGGRVIGIDQDQDAIDEAQKTLSEFDSNNYHLVKDNFSNLDQIASSLNLPIYGILFDLGVSNHQLSARGRGFSFQNNEELDMRMDQGKISATAKDLINGLYENELTRLLTEYGEERFAKQIAEKIVKTRKISPITTTKQLKDIVTSIYEARYSTRSRINPATKTFQALRILVNDELISLTTALNKSINILNSNGHIVVISFHSLEDKIVKDTFRSWTQKELGEMLTKKPIIPSDFEMEINPQSRSAKLRIFKKN
jgi:16S rRNA (cytosine1402-N4)-methyltransferase